VCVCIYGGRSGAMLREVLWDIVRRIPWQQHRKDCWEQWKKLSELWKKTVHPANKQSAVLRTKKINVCMYVYTSSKEKKCLGIFFLYIHIIVILFSLFVSILYYRYVFINMETWSDAKTFFYFYSHFRQPHLIVQTVRENREFFFFSTSRSIWQNIYTTCLNHYV